LADWRDEVLCLLRALIKEADPKMGRGVEVERTVVWSHEGLICASKTYKNVLKMTFAKGRSAYYPKL